MTDEDKYKRKYMQIQVEVLTKENLDRLEKHCKKAIHYERGNIREEHEVVLALLYKYLEQQVLLEKQDNRIKELEEALEEKNRTIEKMAKYIEKTDMDEYTCQHCKHQDKDCTTDECIEVIIEYFEKKEG